jgi:glycosyltransferase involved in cell wall biosynthesis
VNAGKNPLRLAIFASHPTQYQAPIFRALAAIPGIKPVILFGSDHGVTESFDSGFGHAVKWDIPLLEGYEHRFLTNVARRKDVNAFMGISVPSVRAVITRESFDAVLVMGWQTRGHVQAIRAARRARVPILLMGDSILATHPSSSPKATMRRLFWLPIRKKLYAAILSRIDGALTVGTRNEAYFRSFGLTSEKLHWVGHGVDNDRFDIGPRERAEARKDIRSGLGFSADDFVFLSVAKIQEKKRPLDLFAAFHRIAERHSNARLLYLGDGPLRSRLESEIRALGLESRARVIGFVNQAELPRWYAECDCLVLPSDSRETWGLAVNEALASGMPVVVSDAVGCAPDLVKPGVNGRIFSFGDVESLVEAMTWAIEMTPQQRESVAVEARATVANASPSRIAARIANAVLAVTPR